MPADEFVFSPPGKTACPPDTFVARLTGRVDNREKLLTALQKALQLPDYFGHNWDALDECLADLNWISQHTVCLVHEKLPGIAERDLRTYLSVLADAVRHWQSDDTHKLAVVFPVAARQRIEKLRSGN
jgi:RNAse (barnase) inhibitor barstar